MSSVRWRSSSTWTTQVPFCDHAPNSSRYVCFLLTIALHPQYNLFFVASSLADISSFRRSHGRHSLISLRSWQPRRCSASSSPEHTPFRSLSIPRSSSVSSQSLLQKAPNHGFLGCMHMGCRRAWRPRCAGLSMFHGRVIGFWHHVRRHLGRRRQITCFGCANPKTMRSKDTFTIRYRTE